jgi:hypothetical protein
MNHGPEFGKWMELRAKTDRQLAAFLNKTLAKGLRLALDAAEYNVPEFNARAQAAYSEARRLLPCLRNPAAERRILERDFTRLGQLLNGTARAGECAGAACSKAGLLF